MSMVPRQVYDPRNFTWDYWCALTAEQFAANQLGTVPETQWQDWANSLCGIGRFAGVPDGRVFDNWQDWACAFNNALRK
jgi:hypothetical protein